MQHPELRPYFYGSKEIDPKFFIWKGSKPLGIALRLFRYLLEYGSSQRGNGV